MSTFRSFDQLFKEQSEQQERWRRERRLVHAAIDPIIGEIDRAEKALADISLFDADARYRLARARVEALRVVRAAERVGTSPGERRDAAAAAFIAGGRRDPEESRS